MILMYHPTLVSFAVNLVDVSEVISPEFKKDGHKVICIPLNRNEFDLPDFSQLEKNYNKIYDLIQQGIIVSAHTVGSGGLSETLSKMSFGNKIGLQINSEVGEEALFAPEYGSIIVELNDGQDEQELLKDIDYYYVGETLKEATLIYKNEIFPIDELISQWESTLENVYPTKVEDSTKNVLDNLYEEKNVYVAKNKIAKPTVFIPAFPGTNCEYDTKKAFELAGANVETLVFKNLKGTHIEESIEKLTQLINKSQMVMIPGGFSAGDEPEGSGKFIATVFRNSRIKEAILECYCIKEMV